MENDPVALAITTTAQALGDLFQQVLTHGLEVTPTANGSFLVRIASADGQADTAGTQRHERRAW